MKKKTLTNETRLPILILKDWRRLLLSVDFIAFLAIVIVVPLNYYYKLGYLIDLTDEKTLSWTTNALAASSALFAVILTALAIILSFSTSQFITFLHRNNKLNSLLLTFWLGSFGYLAVVTVSTLSFLINPDYSLVRLILFTINLATFTYSLINTFYIVETIIRFGNFISKFENSGNEGRSNSGK